MRYSMYLTLDHHLDHVASLRDTVAAISVPQRPQVQIPVNGMITHWSG